MAVISQYQVVISGQLITANLWNGMELNIINNGLTPTGIEDYASTDSEYQIQTDPYPGGVLSRPSNLAEELARLRYVIKGITGKSWHYQPPDIVLDELEGYPTHDHTGDGTNGSLIPTNALEDLAVTTAKIAQDAVVEGKIAIGAVTNARLGSDISFSKLVDQIATAQIPDGGVTSDKIPSLPTTKLTGEVGTSLLANAAVTYDKIADGAVYGSKIPVSFVSLSDFILGVGTQDISVASNAWVIGVTARKLQSITVTMQIRNQGLYGDDNDVSTLGTTVKAFSAPVIRFTSGGGGNANITNVGAWYISMPSF